MNWLRKMWERVTGQEAAHLWQLVEDARESKRVPQSHYDHACAERDRFKADFERNEVELALANQRLELSEELHATFHGTEEPEWDAKDCEVLKRFLISDTGKRFKARLNYLEQRCNRDAVHMKANFENATGYARGFGDGFRYITVDLPVYVPPKADDANEEQHGDAALVDRVSP